MTSVVLVLFWFSIASGFLFMSLLTLWLRQRIVPRQIAEAKKEEYFAGADVAKLKIIFDHMLLAELLAFLMTSLSAFVEWATLAGLLD
ncbi:MAG: hypothetical protein WCC94_04930 [Candidatus Bathyarchaeia archaeon]